MRKKKIFGLTEQISNPISAFDCARLIVKLVEKGASGIFHLGGKEFINRYEFAKQIARSFDLDETLISAATSDQHSRPARRPSHAGLDCRITEEYLGLPMPSIGDGLSLIREEMETKRA